MADARGVVSEQRLATGGGTARASARWPGGRGGPERGLDGVGDELRGLRVDDDVPAEQHAADDLPGVPGPRSRLGTGDGFMQPCALGMILKRRSAYSSGGSRVRGGDAVERCVKIQLGAPVNRGPYHPAQEQRFGSRQGNAASRQYAQRPGWRRRAAGSVRATWRATASGPGRA